MPLRGPTILLIEDDLSLRDSLEELLHESGYRTLKAATAKEGWELLRTRAPLLVLLDLNLPDGSGLDLLRRAVAQGIRTRVVVMTAFDLTTLRPGAGCGVGELLAGWLTKPVNPAELLRLVEELVRAGNPSREGDKAGRGL